MEKGEPKIRQRSDLELALAKAELQKFGISPIKENIDAYFLYKETPQRPKGYDDIYNNLDNPEKLKEEMQKRKLTALIHVEGPTVRDHIQLGLERAQKQGKLVSTARFYHDLGKQEVYNNDFNKLQTIKTAGAGRLFQTMMKHASANGEAIEKGLRASGLSKKEIQLGQKLIEKHMSTEILDRKDPTKIISFFETLGDNDEEIKEVISYLAHILDIDYLSTDNITLNNAGEVIYSKDTKKTKFTFEEIRKKYQDAVLPARKLEAENNIYNERINNCEKDLLQIANHLIPLTAENTAFGNNPDNPQEHSPQRHEFGIITHSKKSITHFSRRKQYIRDKNIQEKIDDKLQETIDGKTKMELLATALEFHDIGKFLRSMTVQEGQKLGVDPFKDHEKAGEEVVTHDATVQDIINGNYHLTPDQLKYVAKCIGLHYELGKAREKAKTLPGGYSLAYVDSDYFTQKVCKDIKKDNPDFAMEIGLLFLVDSLAKTDITIQGQNDGQLMSKQERAEQEIQKRDIPTELINSVMQKPVNIAVAKKYLEYIFSENMTRNITSKETFSDTRIHFEHMIDNVGYEYIGFDIEDKLVQPYLEKLKAYLGGEKFALYTKNQQMRDTGKYHVTLITPAELKTLGKDPEIDTEVMYKDLQTIGIGNVEDQGKNAYFIVTEAEKLNEIRKNLGLGNKNFHVTLGFDPDDVFTKPKDKTSLIKKIS